MQEYRNNKLWPKRWKSKVGISWFILCPGKGIDSCRLQPFCHWAWGWTQIAACIDVRSTHPQFLTWPGQVNCLLLLQAYYSSASLSLVTTLFPHRLQDPSCLYKHCTSLLKDHNLKHLGKNISEHYYKNYRIKEIILIMSLDMVQVPCRANVVSISCHWRKASKICNTFWNTYTFLLSQVPLL